MLLDTGPLVAFLNPRDQWHEACAAYWRDLAARFITTEAVLTEASHLVARGGHSAVLPLEVIDVGRIPVAPLPDAARKRVTSLMRRYADLPMDYADASLVVVAEGLGLTHVFTTDRRGFATYRIGGRRRFVLIPPVLE